MDRHQHIDASRRKFLSIGIKLTTFSALIMPFQKVMATGAAVIHKSAKKLYEFLPIDRLVLNTKTKVIHLASGRIFSKYPIIKRKVLIGSSTWETEVKPPYHFNKEKSGIIIEVLALSRLATGINDRTLADAYRILSLAFSSSYKNKQGILLNKYNFRLHHLLLQTITLNNTYPLAQKWTKFQQATGNINYSLKDVKPLPRFMNWITNKAEFDKKANYILQNKQTYTGRLADRASRFKL